MKIARMICVVTAFVVTGAAAQQGDKAISKTDPSKTTIIFGTATPGGGAGRDAGRNAKKADQAEQGRAQQYSHLGNHVVPALLFLLSKAMLS